MNSDALNPSNPSGFVAAALRRLNGRGIAAGALLLALVMLTAACGSSSGDSTQVVNGGATVSPEASPQPATPAGTSPAGTSKEIARQELDNLVQLAQGELTLDRQELTDYSKQVETALNRIDSDPDVLEAFKNLLENMLGVTFVFEDPTSLNLEPPGKVGRALPLFDPPHFSAGPFKCSATDPDYDPYAESKAWRYLRCFMDALFDVNVPGAEALTAADPLFATEITKFAVRTQITDRCITDIERCVRGDDPVLNKFQQGDIAGAHKTIRELALTPEPTRGPTQATTRAPTAVPTLAPPSTATQMPTATPAPTATLKPASTSAPIAESDFSGTWVGRYIGLYHHDFPICGSTISIEGSITVVLTQIGTQVTGSATLGGSNVIEIAESDGSCSIVKRSDEVTMIAASVSGDTVTSAPGLPLTFSLTKISENSAEGTTKDPYLDATLFLGRLR